MHHHRRRPAHPEGARHPSARTPRTLSVHRQGQPSRTSKAISASCSTKTIARRAPDFIDESPKPEHGRRERRSIWVSSALNDYLDFPGVGQVFAVRRDTVEVKSGKRSCETVYGLTSLTPQAASPQRLLTLNRGHWTIEATHHILDWSFDEDRSRIRSGHGPENMTRLRRFAIGLIKSRGLAVAETMRRLARNPRARARLPQDDREHRTARRTRLSSPPAGPCIVSAAPLDTRGAARHAPMPPSVSASAATVTRHYDGGPIRCSAAPPTSAKAGDPD